MLKNWTVDLSSQPVYADVFILFIVSKTFIFSKYFVVGKSLIWNFDSRNPWFSEWPVGSSGNAPHLFPFIWNIFYPSSIQVKYEEGMALARQLGCKYYETSAYLRKCIDDVFHGIVKEIRDKEEQERLGQDGKAKKKPGKVKRFLTSLQPNHLFKQSSSPSKREKHWLLW